MEGPSALTQAADLLLDWNPREKRVRAETVKRAEQTVERARANELSVWQEFGKKYWADPVGFAEQCLRWPKGKGLTAYQSQILAAIPIKERVCVRGPHGLGKSMMCSLSVLWFALTRDACSADWKIITTAGTYDQLKRYLWPEVHKWSNLLIWDKVGRAPFHEKTELLEMSLKLQYGQAFALSPDQPGNIEGAHADHLYYCYDESKLIIPQVWDAAEGAFSGSGDGSHFAYALAISTPGDPIGRFYDIQVRKKGYEDWWPRAVTWDEANEAGRITLDWTNKRAKQWGRGSALFQQKVLGNFCASDEDSVVPLSWVEAANERWNRLYPDEDADGYEIADAE